MANIYTKLLLLCIFRAWWQCYQMPPTTKRWTTPPGDEKPRPRPVYVVDFVPACCALNWRAAFSAPQELSFWRWRRRTGPRRCGGHHQG